MRNIHHTKDVIGFIVPDEKIKSKAENLIKSRSKNNIVLVEALAGSNILKQAKALVEQGANIIVARGGTYHHLEENLDIPIVNLKINNIDILQALNKARSLEGNLYLLLEHSVYFDYSKWRDLINIQFEIIKYKHYSEIEPIVNKIHQLDEKAIIIGGILTVSEARKLNHKAILIETQEENILEAYQQALDILNSIKENKKRMRLLTSIIQNVEDGVLVLTNDYTIEYFNGKSLTLLNTKNINRNDNITKYIREFGNIIEKYRDRGAKNIIQKLPGKTLSINIIPLWIDGLCTGYVITMKDIGELQSLEKKIRYELNKKGLIAKHTFDDIITCDDSMYQVIEKAKKIAQSDSTVLIYGESGTGKEIIAQSIHNYSSRSNAPFVAVNCAALSESLLESELFGYVEGAFTGARKEGKAGLFELAHGGTIFLDEINSMSLKLQSKLLRVIEEKEVMRLGSDYIIPLDIRLISASNVDLLKEVQRGNFRADLFFRLNVLEIMLPSLRDRREDIILLFEHFVSQLTNENFRVDDKLRTILLNHEWYGNVRELMNTAQRYVLYGYQNYNDLFSYREENADIIDFSKEIRIDVKELKNKLEDSIIRTLEQNGFNKNQIADILGISRTALWKKMSK